MSVRRPEWALRLWRGPVRRLVDQIAERTGLEATVVVLLAAAGFVVAAAGVGFTAMLEDVMEGDGIAGADPTVQRFFVEHRNVGLTDAFRAITWLGGAAVVAPLVAVTILFLIRRHEHLLAFGVALATIAPRCWSR